MGHQPERMHPKECGTARLNPAVAGFRHAVADVLNSRSSLPVSTACLIPPSREAEPDRAHPAANLFTDLPSQERVWLFWR